MYNPPPAGVPRSSLRRSDGLARSWCWPSAPGQAASRPVEVVSVWLGLGSSNTFKVGTWTPVWVQLHGGDVRFEGFMEVVVADDDGTPTSYFTRVNVGSKANQTFTAYVRPGTTIPSWRSSCMTVTGGRWWPCRRMRCCRTRRWA